MAGDLPPDNECASLSEGDAAFPALASLASVSRVFAEALPVESWTPPFCGDIDMRIARDGTWFYQGSKIERPAMVQLFARLLRKDDERYVLVTPVERVGIKVEDVPFIASELMAREDDSANLTFLTNVGDAVTADAAHPLRFETGAADGLIPYLLVRGGLWARLTPALTIELVALGTTQEIDGTLMFGIASAGAFFPIAPAAEFE